MNLDAAKNDTELSRFRQHDGILGLIERILLISIPISSVIFIFNIPQRLGMLIWGEQYLALFLGLTLISIFLLVPAINGKNNAALPWYDVVLCIISLVCTLYVAVNWPDIVETGGIITWTRAILGLLTIICLLEANRRLFGWPLVLLAALFIVYALFMNYFPGPLYGNPVPWKRLTTSLYLDINALFGVTLKVAATVVAAFVLFGSLLFATSGGKFLIDLSLAIFGRLKGGVVKAPLVASGIFGSISGVAVANIYTTGQITIPLMKRYKIDPNFAAAIEATASTGGLILPPVMGIVAFIMAVFLNTTYAQVSLAAVIPALLYYLALYVQVDRYSAKFGQAELSLEEVPSLKKVIYEGWPYLIPFAVIVYCLFIMGLEAEQSALYAVIVLLIISVFRKNDGISFKKILAPLEETGKGILEISSICALAGILIGVIMLTGIGFSLTRIFIALGTSQLFLLLIIAGLMCIILGMGMPIVTVYIIVAILVAPAMIRIGISPMAAHMFVFYFGMLSFLTPPIMLSVYAAASLARSNPWVTAWKALRLGVAAYIVPFAFVYNPSLLLEGSAVDILLSALSAAVGVCVLAVAIEGFLFGKLGWINRILLLASSLLLLMPNGLMRLMGLIFAGALIFFEWTRTKSPVHNPLEESPSGEISR